MYGLTPKSTISSFLVVFADVRLVVPSYGTPQKEGGTDWAFPGRPRETQDIMSAGVFSLLSHSILTRNFKQVVS